jgi:hypothetical protein
MSPLRLRVRWLIVSLCVASAGCGRIGIELLDNAVSMAPSTSAAQDAGPDDASLAGKLDAQVVMPARSDAAPTPANVDANAGVRVDGAAAVGGPLDQPCALGLLDCDAGAIESGCSLTGTWAAKLDFAVTWPAATVIASGSGRVTYWQRLDLTQTRRGDVSGSAITCGVVIPDTLTLLGGGESFGVIEPAALFDVEPPLFPAAGISLLLGGFEPGATFMLPPLVQARGIMLTDPATDAWPIVAAAGVSRDDDADGQPGFSLDFKTGGGLSYPALDVLYVSRADRGYVADRLIYGASGTLTSCSAASGSASVVTFDTRILGCHVAGGDICSTAQRDLLDRNSPAYTPGDASFLLRKLPDGAGCADVRATLP